MRRTDVLAKRSAPNSWQMRRTAGAEMTGQLKTSVNTSSDAWISGDGQIACIARAILVLPELEAPLRTMAVVGMGWGEHVAHGRLAQLRIHGGSWLLPPF